MKKLLPFILVTLLVMSCKDDDDVTIPMCGEPTAVSISDITFESASISWEDANEDPNFIIEYGLSGFILGSGTTMNSSLTELMISGLQANTTYDVYIKSVCSTTNESMYSEVSTFTTLAPLVIAQYLANLSDLNLFSGNLSDLTPSIYAFEYDLATPLFTDYATKQRLIALPLGTSMDFVDDGFPNFPDNTLIAKTFFYNIDDRDESLGKTIIETRVLIKRNGEWELGNYKWNEDQTDATLDTEGADLVVNYIDDNGDNNVVNYKIPAAPDCFTCHSNAGDETPIGPKIRNLNFNNQLQDFISNSYISGISDASSVMSLPNWEGDSYTREQRVRAYFDVNCAHCHTAGGYCEVQSPLRLSYETAFDDTSIYNQRFSIIARMQNYIEGFSMPFIGTTMVHDEGFDLIQAYLNSL